MPFVYNKLFKLLEEMGISTYELRKRNIISQSPLQKMRKGEGVIDTRTLEKICRELHCQPGDIMEYVEDVKDDPEQKEKHVE